MTPYLCIIFENCHFHKFSLFYPRFTVFWPKSKTEIEKNIHVEFKPFT